ncbi:MAG: hypothetical protein GKS01_10150 [Alphaproteobacteria bacterium]|nr:hypothetical protein [Alphaproteobacteria bacterium]
MPYTEEFLEKVAPLYNEQMGTENMAPLLHSLINFHRPQRLLEVGAGYTTPFIAQALRDVVDARAQEATDPDNPNHVAEHYAVPYAPKLLCIDNHTLPSSTSAKVQALMGEMGLDDLVDFVEADITEYSEQIDQSFLPLDFVWFDCGALKEYFLFFNNFWRFVNPKGGLLLMHSTLTNLEISTFIKSIKLLQATSDFNNIEILSLLEPHKKAQSSVTMFRRTTEVEETIYTLQP